MIGKTIDNYQIIEEIGRGGMGIVYKALDTSLEKIVALKMIDPNLAGDAGFLKRFKTEARALARLENPNIVIVHALRETEFGLFMVMEYVDAQTVADHIREKGAFPVEEIIHITKQLLNAIGHAHTVEVIHRDIKPSNILVYNDGRVKVMDFGLAKVIRQRGPASTVTQGRAGTLYYMSPEQVKGLQNVDFRSDIYSLGMTVYEMCAGRVPFEKTESDFSIQKQIVEGKIPSVNIYNPSIPKQLHKIIQKSIEKDPNKRYQNCREMLEAIEAFESSWIEEKKDTGEIGSIKYKTPLVAVAASVILVVLIILIIKIIGFFPGPEMISVSIRSIPPGASVYVDSELLGITPLDDFEVPQGELKLQIHKEGMSLIDTLVSVVKGQPSLFSFELKPRGVLVPADAIAETEYGGIRVTSTPEGSSVYLDDQYVGTTPYTSDQIPVGRYRLNIRRSGYESYVESIIVDTETRQSISASLVAIGKISVSSEPSGASVIVNGRYAGTTPYENSRMPVGSYDVVLRKEGFDDYQTAVQIQQQSTREVRHTFAVPRGTLTILVRPWGSIYINQELKVSDTFVPYVTELGSGKYRIAVVHPELGRWERDVLIEKDVTKELLVDFNKRVKVVVTSDPPAAEIFLNNVPSGEYTPKQLNLTIGSYTIEVRKEGYSLQGGPMVVNLDDDLTEPIHFRLQRQ
jgi:eukaryotic-like serine/threonine-protein kinase